ncbi:MAG: FAD-dependent monooxygenase [Xanthomonadales bacterium]|nr:FAD-dependent monooxygenase [Gammaproteobacteria bacterium]MBT8053497.1 FAD-dependent monooxygenase [Gammaproteobacteria bacterium]NND55865.1 FAD-dependent monooxygenase [Xanthomonadales bacterium]NNK50915.1 FAD-dependent monooxygenase [Xanthomonadales bacterium]
MREREAIRSVVITGAGPVGLFAAVLLVKAGIRVIVLEKNDNLVLDRRASTFHSATLDLLDRIGLADPLIARGSIRQSWQYMIHGTKNHVVFDLESISDMTPHPFRLQCEQFYFSDLAIDYLLATPLFEMRFGNEVTGLELQPDSVKLKVEKAGEEYELSTPWLIAADGGNSRVRQLLDMSFEGSFFPRTAITVVLKHPFQDEIPGLLGINYVWTETGYYSLVQVRDLWRFSYSPDPDQPLDEALAKEAVQAHVQSVFPSLQPYELVALDHYTLQQRCLESFRKERVLFAGDAAHLDSPSGGMGMNSGMHDANCLVEHLLPVLAGADDVLLDRFARRRRIVTLEEIQRLSERNYRWHIENRPEQRAEIWRKLQDMAGDHKKCRDYLLDSAMIRSRWREKEID